MRWGYFILVPGVTLAMGLFVFLEQVFFDGFRNKVHSWVNDVDSSPVTQAFAMVVVWTLPEVLVGIVAFALLRWWLLPDARAKETCCRRCGYILRGLRDPRCPECGEAI